MLVFIKEWLTNIQRNHGVNPLIFGGLYLVCALPFWVSIYKIIAAIKNRNSRQAISYGIILSIAVVTPYLYVAIFGRNLPLWFWFLIVTIVSYSAWSVLKKIRRSQKV